MRKRTRQIVLLVVILLFAGASYATIQKHLANRLVVVNRSHQAMTFIEISVNGQTIRFDNIPSNAEVEFTFEISGDSSFVVDGQLDDGTKLTGDYGYVTNGMSRCRIRMTDQPDGSIEYHEITKIGIL